MWSSIRGRWPIPGYPVEAGGLDDNGRYRYTYHQVEGLRVEMADARARAAFERWATSGRADGVADELSLPDPV